MNQTLKDQLNVLNIDTKLHQEQLRRSLLTSSYWQKQDQKSFISIFLKGGEHNMKRKQFAVIGSIFTLLVAAYAVFTVVTPNNSLASAQEMAQKGYEKVAAMTTSEVSAMRTKLGDDPLAILKSVAQSKDAVKISYEEMVKNFPWVTQAPSGAGTPDYTKLHYIKSTDPSGGLMFVGLDEENLPVFAAGQATILPAGETNQLPLINGSSGLIPAE